MNISLNALVILKKKEDGLFKMGNKMGIVNLLPSFFSYFPFHWFGGSGGDCQSVSFFPLHGLPRVGKDQFKKKESTLRNRNGCAQ